MESASRRAPPTLLKPGPSGRSWNLQALDCESFDSAVNSCAEILGLSRSVLLNRVMSFAFEEVPESERRRHPYKDLFLRKTFGFERPLLAPPSVMWFHATRVPEGTTFEDGLVPLSGRLDLLWEFLGQLADDWSTAREWKAFRNDMGGVGGRQYAWKVNSGHDEGPFAFLVRDIIFQPEPMDNHDYLGIPEIVEDICLSYEETYGRSLRERFVNRTRPCIVKFRATDSRPDALEAALLYIHRESRSEDLWTPCNTCYSGEGRSIPPASIVSVEWQPYQPQV
jgi:hypothetical protein